MLVTCLHLELIDWNGKLTSEAAYYLKLYGSFQLKSLKFVFYVKWFHKLDAWINDIINRYMFLLIGFQIVKT